MTGSAFVEMRKLIGPLAIVSVVALFACVLFFLGKENGLGLIAFVIALVSGGFNIAYFIALCKFTCPNCGVHPYDRDGLYANDEMHCPHCKVQYDESPWYKTRFR